MKDRIRVTFIKSINKQKTRFSVNGKLAVLRYGPNKLIQNISYSKELTEQEEIKFKDHLRDIEKIS